jgi:prepilin-type N-terminal cleavage/methylation domain-containing protein
MKSRLRETRAGFTLIELMIVIAIIAVIAAIAIPGLIASQRASNERNASATLKTLTSAEVDFRSNDRDGNHVLDFWTRDVSGLYGMCPIGSTEPIKLIELSVCGADANPLGTAATPAAAEEMAASSFTLVTPKASYWYLSLINDELGIPYRMTTTNGLSPLDAVDWFHTTKFGFLAFPESYTSGRSMFYVNEGNTLFKRSTTGTVRPAGGTVPPGTALIVANALGPSDPLKWPTDSELRLDYSKLD